MNWLMATNNHICICNKICITSYWYHGSGMHCSYGDGSHKHTHLNVIIFREGTTLMSLALLEESAHSHILWIRDHTQHNTGDQSGNWELGTREVITWSTLTCYLDWDTFNTIYWSYSFSVFPSNRWAQFGSHQWLRTGDTCTSLLLPWWLG